MLNFSYFIILFLVANLEAAINYQLLQPQIYVDDGHLYLLPAENRNLVLVTNGTGKILFNDLELTGLVASVTNSTRDLTSFKRAFGVPTNSSSRFANRIQQLEQSLNRLSQLDSLDARLVSVERQIAYPNGTAPENPSSSTSDTSSGSGGVAPPSGIGGLAQRLSRLQTRIKNLETRVRNLGSAARNPCSSNPCANGAKCIPTIFGAFCSCPKGWEGERCSLDVNECTSFYGTDLGCLNGGTCTNLPGSYQCQCRSGWFGIHCAQRSGDCSSGPAWELCGHGICVNQQAGSRPYTCICEQGWKTDGTNPACSVDVDECNGPHPSCSRNPPVPCINTPGSFHCGFCPSGYTGNGYQCADVNECLQNNGGCSMNPMVQCLNTVGSRSCGQCPPGYIGNGESCQYIGVCQINNGGCHPLARCVGNPGIGQTFVQCLCPAGYTGTGMGLHGCFPYSGGGGGTGTGDIVPVSNPCLSNPCQHGSCSSYGNTFNCHCFPGFTGVTCNLRDNPCHSSPCQNGGTCSQSSTAFTCNCPNDFTGLLCERQEESGNCIVMKFCIGCGGDIFATEGILRYPHSSGQNYNHNQNCMWRIVTTPGKVLNITFLNFHLEGGGSYCNFDWLQINDGRDSASPLIGKFCGNELPRAGNFSSTHESLFFWFRSDHSTVGLGFEFVWNTTDSLCGDSITDQSHGSIQSPGYPGRYPHGRDCMWSISVNPSKRIQLVFATLQIEVHPNCSYDYLEVLDGIEESAPRLAMYCNTTLPPPIISSGPHLILRFHSDDSSSDIGFHVTFAEVPGIPGCGGVFTEGQGAFSSPQHPEPYPHGLDCEYLIRLPSVDERLTLTFLYIELEAAQNCRWDYVEIRDGSRPDSRLIGRFCGTNIPPVIRSSTNTLLVRFRSDSSVAFGGFRAQYKALCGGNFGMPTGILRSPYYPAAYPKNRNCIFVISQPVNQAIRLDFQDFDVEGANDIRCYFDFLEIRDGDDENSTLVGHFCGGPQSMPDPIISTLNYLWIRFKTDDSVQSRGFLANYSTFDISCGGILKASHGILSSPGHPEVYPHGVTCRWIIRGVPGQVIRLNWVSFSLERNTNCRYDAVEIYDNSTFFRNGSLIGRYCGNDLPPIITTSDYTMTVIFISDHSVAHDGFMANYVLVNSSTVCGGNYFSSYGVMRSPGHPNPYPDGKSCTWTIRAPSGQQIMLNITNFDVENGTSRGCIFDYLEIRNGGYQTSPLVGKFCGSNLPPSTIPSFSNSLFLKFSTDSSRTGNGFQIFWDATTQGCGGTLNAPSGSIISPNYPMSSSMSSSMSCFWTISVNKGSSIQFTFVDLDLERSSGCWGEFVEIRDGSKADDRLIGKYCLADTVLAINSSGNALRIKFISSYGSAGRGFHATYQSICTRKITGHSGVIESPNFPNPYPHHRSCNFTIEAPMGNMLNLSFSHFALEQSHFYTNSCLYDFVEISEVSRFNHETPTPLHKFCGDTIPPMISSTKDTVIVRFESDATTALNGFRLEWVVNGCGGSIIGNWGILKSPNYPRPYPKSVACIWTIISDPGTKVQLTIYELDIETAQNCVFDYLKIYGGDEENSPLLTELCHKSERSQTITSHGNKMLVKFGSDGSIAGKGFYGLSNSLPGGCGGRIEAPTGFIYSPNYPSNYDSNEDCGWLITVAYKHVVELSFMEFNIETHNNCSYDHVAVYDGRSIHSPLLLMACGNDIPGNVKSSGNQIFIRLKTDDSATGRGFKANFTTGCGGRLVEQTSGVIASPGFPHFIFKMNCTWFIQGPQPEDRVTLTFTHLDIQSRFISQENCTTSYVEVLDGEDLDAPSVGKFCLSRVPPSLTSRGNGLIVRILTENAYGLGFRAVYDVSTSACGGTLTSAEGSFTTPNYPNGYPMNAECVWTIKASAGNRVAISFRRMDIESNEYCNTDFVEIHEEDSAGRLLGHFCGNDIPTNLTASKALWVLFRSDSDGQAPGFFVDYTLIHGNELNGSYGVLESPLYPLPYNLMGTFSWRITVNFTQSIQITFSDFDFGHDDSSFTCSNVLKIFDGYDDTATELLARCDQALPEIVTSTGNVVFVSFVKVVPSVQSIFRLSWQEVSTTEQIRTQLSVNITGCGGNLTILDGDNITTLLSPGFTENGYPAMANCEWIINTIGFQRIKIKVEAMDLEGHPTCLYDKMEVYDGVNGLPNFELNKTLCQRSDIGTVLLSSGRTVKIVFVSDSSYNRQGFNLSLSTQCGGIIKDTRGRITSPRFPQNYGNSQCSWSISVRPGRTVGVQFDSFDIYRGSQTECSTDIITLRNGGMPDSPLLGQGRYCGSTIPTIPETSGNQLSVQFIAWTSGGRGFAMIFSEISAGCGGQIHLTNDANDVLINSPSYPNPPPPFTECEWVFTCPQNEALQLEFQLNFQLENVFDCSKEGVEIRDGGTRLSRQINLLCGEMPGTQKSTGNIMYVRYYTTINEPRIGFKAKVSIAKCGGIMVGWSGVFTSPGYPAFYDVNLDCEWTLRGPENTLLTLTFVDLEMGSGSNVTSGNNGNCTTDWLLITEEGIDGIDSPRNWTFCDFSDNSLLNRIQTGTNQVRILFHSDSLRETRKGFKLNYRASSERCGGILTAPSGIIQSPGYPTSYPHYRSCYWRIIAPEGRRIRIEFLDFDLEEKFIRPDGSGNCPDHLFISHGEVIPGRLYNVTTGGFCGTTLPSPIETTSNYMTLSFRTDGSVSHRGFKASYTTDLPSVCGGALIGDNGVVASPSNWTSTANLTFAFICQWQHLGETSNGTTIIKLNEVKIPPWDTATDTGCLLAGVLLVYPIANQPRSWKGYCKTVNQKLYLPGSGFNIAYIAIHQESYFNLTYQVVGCGGVLVGPNNTIYSPNFPNNYQANLECIWILNYPGGSQVRLVFTDLDLDDHRNDDGCDNDFVVVRNGRYPSSPILGTYCGTSTPSEIVSMSPNVWIEFHSDGESNGNRRGFRIEADVLEKGCGGTIHQKNGQFRSPRVGRLPSLTTSTQYPAMSNCEWIIETVPGYVVNIVFKGRFDIETSANCTNDFVEIFNKKSNSWNSVGKFCGKQLPAPINTTSTSVKILFRSNQDISGDGFQIIWYSPCGGLYNEEDGMIRSAHFDRYNHLYQNNAGGFTSYYYWEYMYKTYTCDYVIQGNSTNDYIVAEFLPPFEVSYRPGWLRDEPAVLNACPYVNVSFTELYPHSIWRRNGGLYCGVDLPPAFIGRGGVTITYNYLPALNNFGFKLRYQIYQCGGVITEPRTLHSPGHPFPYASNMNCTWVITAPIGKVVRFKIEKLELEYSPNCRWDAIILYDGDSINEARKLGTFCGNLTQTLRRISSKSNVMTIQFRTDATITQNGFLGALDFTIGELYGCGGTVNASSQSQSIRSPDFNLDGKYESFLECNWMVVGADFQIVELLFSSFVLEGGRRIGPSRSNSSEDCPYDLIEIRDGPGPFGEILGTFCGNAIPPRIISSANFMWITFVSDGTNELSGFTATLTSRPSPCGPSFVLNATSTAQVLTSPNYPDNYASNLRCKWTVDGARVQDEVDIRFIDLMTESSPDCNKDRLEIRDISTSYTSPEGIGGPILFSGNRPIDWRFRSLGIDSASIMQNFKYCGSQTPSDFFSIGRSAEILFISDSTTVAKGFKVEYKAAGCNRTFENSQGRIFSPEWPANPPFYTSCVIMIRTQNSTFVSLFFNQFLLVDSESCSETFFEVRENGPSGQLLAKYCGSVRPNPVFSNSNVVWVNFVTRLRMSRGYDISYTSTSAGVGCGGDLFHTGGSVASPGYPGNFSQPSDCRWRLRVPGGLKIQLEFTSFILGGDCATDFVELFSMNSHQPAVDPLLFTRYCPGDSPSVYNSDTDTAMIRYKTSANSSGIGWRAEFRGITSSTLPV